MSRMDEHLQARVISQLRQDNIRLWLEPFTTDHQHIQDLADRYASVTGFAVDVVRSALEIIQSEAVMKGEGNKEYKETSVATLELHLPKETQTRKAHFKTKLDITAHELKKEISKQYGLQHFNLILKGKTLAPEKRLGEQNVKNNSKIMVLNVSSEDERNEMLEGEKEKRSEDEGVQRTQKGFQILSERDGSEDPATTPFLEITDQKGNPLQIPDTERKALIMAMGFHEKGRALMKKRKKSSALCYLLRADEQFQYDIITHTHVPQSISVCLSVCLSFCLSVSRDRVCLCCSKCDSAILNTVDNFAVLQLDIVWCYQLLNELSCLDDAKQRLQSAERCFQRCYGDQQSRLQQIKVHTGGEDVLFLRLYLLQSSQAYHTGDENRASLLLNKVQELYGQLCLDPEKLNQLMYLGFSDQEARLGLRACRGNIDEAALHLTQRRKEKEEMKEREREKRRRRLQDINTLVELGYSKRDATKALHHAKGDVDKAYGILLDRAEDQTAHTPDWTGASNASLTGDEGMSQSPPSSSSEEPSTSSDPPSVSSPLDEELVNEVLGDIPRHEEDYLDLSLDEEQELIARLRSYLEK
ncbi:NEDD8 ultimate buster 1 [Triplophysa rosa]|uniref:NEDD8 ultimate buster 1 n=1 Tax=Triplophysa rosa TaxID=992332 RepID=UPI002545D6E4|nr:NEDD8 ultimate buster 1 [Triplophysa rosa]